MRLGPVALEPLRDGQFKTTWEIWIKKEKGHGKKYTKLDRLSAWRGQGITLMDGFCPNYSTWSMRATTLFPDKSTGNTRSRFDRPEYFHIGHALSPSGTIRQRMKMSKTRSPLKPSSRHFRNARMMILMWFLRWEAGPHVQLSRFVGLPPVNFGNGASSGFRM